VARATVETPAARADVTTKAAATTRRMWGVRMRIA
jgi:hypothetical protein